LLGTFVYWLLRIDRQKTTELNAPLERLGISSPKHARLFGLLQEYSSLDDAQHLADIAGVIIRDYDDGIMAQSLAIQLEIWRHELKLTNDEIRAIDWYFVLEDIAGDRRMISF
jgi:hypothetical protein